MGFGFVEVGTVTPKGQPGNPKPRMFRLPEANALINRLGFNNDGLDAFLANVKKSAIRQKNNPLLLGLNIGKNAATPIENAVDDYLICLEDGKKVKMLKRYLRTNFGMTPAQYRTKWGLPLDYPMAAPNYTQARSDFAKLVGFGRKKKRTLRAAKV